MVVLVNNETGRIINEGDALLDSTTGRTGKYTGWMPAHARNSEGLIYIRFPGKEWDESFLPPNIGCKLVDI